MKLIFILPLLMIPVEPGEGAVAGGTGVLSLRLKLVSILPLLMVPTSQDCPAPKGGYITKGNNVASGCSGCSTTGWMDCSKKCEVNPSCKAWTLHKPSNDCWLKSNFNSIGNHVDWSWGMPCKGALLPVAVWRTKDGQSDELHLFLSCSRQNSKYSPIDDISGQGRSVERDATACQNRCARVAGCSFFSFWADGGCHLSSGAAVLEQENGVTAGPTSCFTTGDAQEVGAVGANQAEECKDRDHSCQYFIESANFWACKGMYSSWATEYCQKSCKLCPPDGKKVGWVGKKYCLGHHTDHSSCATEGRKPIAFVDTNDAKYDLATIKSVADYKNLCITCSTILWGRGGILQKKETYDSDYIQTVIKVTKNIGGPKITYLTEAGIMKIHAGNTPLDSIDFHLFGGKASIYTDIGKGAGFEATVFLSGGSVSIFDLQLGVGVSSEIGIIDDSVVVKVAGVGVSLGRKTGFCVFDNCFDVDIGKFFG